MKAVMYGAGNIGRGFVGALMRAAGYTVTFIDVDRELVGRLNEAGRYTLRLISNEGQEDRVVDGIRAVDGGDNEAVMAAIAECDLMATAVGVRVLPRIAPLIAGGLQKRREAGGGPLNIIICENLLDADKLLKKLLLEALPRGSHAWFEQNTGLVEASIGRMVPIQTDEMRAGDSLRVCAEGYAFLPVDQAAFKGGIPEIPGLVPYTPFDFYLKRKLYLHNMGHAVCAYLGQYLALDTIAGAIQNPHIQLLTNGAMAESAQALALAYGADTAALQAHAEDLVYRFHNRALGDSTARVGADIPRKLGRDDRLIGAGLLCLKTGIQPVRIALGAAAALHLHMKANNLKNAGETLKELSGLDDKEALAGLILRLVPLFEAGVGMDALHAAALEEKHRLTGPVV